MTGNIYDKQARPARTEFRRSTKGSSQAALVSGMLAGVAGLLVFLVIHALWITPIWFILPIGLFLALLGGAVVGWAHAEVEHRLPHRPWTAAAVAAFAALILIPATILAELRQPMFAITPGGSVFQMELGRAIVLFIVELPLTAAIMGALLGWWLARTHKAAVALALAAVIFALGPGHNIPFIGGTGGVGKEWIIMGAVIAVAAVVQTVVYARLVGKDVK